MTTHIKNCPVCQGRGKVYYCYHDSHGRFVRLYRCGAPHKWKSVEIPFSPETKAQKTAMVITPSYNPKLLKALSQIRISLTTGKIEEALGVAGVALKGVGV